MEHSCVLSPAFLRIAEAIGVINTLHRPKFENLKRQRTFIFKKIEKFESFEAFGRTLSPTDC